MVCFPSAASNAPTVACMVVVNVAGASLLVHQKQIDSAFIAASLDEDTQQLCAELDSLGMVRVFLTPERAAREPTFVRDGQIKNLCRKLRAAAIATPPNADAVRHSEC